VLLDSKNNIKIYRGIFCILLVEYLVMLFSGVTWSGLQGDTFFSIHVDPIVWLYYLTGLPAAILSSSWIGIFLDILTIGLLIFMIRYRGNQKVAIALFVLLACFYLTLTGYLTHRNYQSGIFWVVFPFMFSGKAKELAFDAVRYFLLFFYFSAAMYKLLDGALWYTMHFSDYLSGQFAPYFLEGNIGWRTHLNLFFVHHFHWAHFVYILSFILEIVAIVGFFTKRYDRLILLLLICFHIGDWILMDIGTVGQLAFLGLLFFRKVDTTSSE